MSPLYSSRPGRPGTRAAPFFVLAAFALGVILPDVKTGMVGPVVAYVFAEGGVGWRAAARVGASFVFSAVGGRLPRRGG